MNQTQKTVILNSNHAPIGTCYTTQQKNGLFVSTVVFFPLSDFQVTDSVFVSKTESNVKVNLKSFLRQLFRRYRDEDCYTFYLAEQVIVPFGLSQHLR